MLSAVAIALGEVMPSARSSSRTGATSRARSPPALGLWRRPDGPRRRSRRCHALGVAEPDAARPGGRERRLVRSEIRRRSFSASAAYRCSMIGSASAPSSATMNGTRCAIRPAMKATSRESRSSLATMIGQPWRSARRRGPQRGAADARGHRRPCRFRSRCTRPRWRCPRRRRKRSMASRCASSAEGGTTLRRGRDTEIGNNRFHAYT